MAKPWTERRRAKLRVRSTWGMGASGRARVAHRLDALRCRLYWDPVFPEWTEYQLYWECAGPRIKGPVRLFRGEPTTVPLCATCSDPMKLAARNAAVRRAMGRKRY